MNTKKDRKRLLQIDYRVKDKSNDNASFILADASLVKDGQVNDAMRREYRLSGKFLSEDHDSGMCVCPCCADVKKVKIVDKGHPMSEYDNPFSYGYGRMTDIKAQCEDCGYEAGIDLPSGPYFFGHCKDFPVRTGVFAEYDGGKLDNLRTVTDVIRVSVDDKNKISTDRYQTIGETSLTRRQQPFRSYMVMNKRTTVVPHHYDPFTQLSAQTTYTNRAEVTNSGCFDIFNSPAPGFYVGKGRDMHWSVTSVVSPRNAFDATTDTHKKINDTVATTILDLYGLSIKDFAGDERCTDRWSGDITDVKARQVAAFCVRFPALAQYEIDKTKENLSFARQRGEDVPSDSKAVATRLMDVYDKVSLMDKALVRDMAKLSDPKQVEPYARSIVFGTKPDDGVLPSSIKVNPENAMMSSLGGKKLKKTFNKDMYSAMNTVRTALKLDITEASQVGHLLDVADAKDSGIIKTMDTQGDMRLARLMSKVRNKNEIIDDLYGTDAEGNNNNINLFEDCVGLYNGFPGAVALTKEECAMVRTRTAMDMAQTFKDNGAPLAGSKFEEAWGDKAGSMIEGLLEKRKEYEDAGLFRHQKFIATDAEPLFQRDIRHLHDELIKIQNKGARRLAVNETYEWKGEKYEGLNASKAGYSFHLAKDSQELINVGNELNICVGGEGYDRNCRDRSAPIVLMTKADGAYVACIELNKNCDRIAQFKAYQNTALTGQKAIAAATEWMEDNGIAGNGDTERFGQIHYFYGHGNFRQNRVLQDENQEEPRSRSLATKAQIYKGIEYLDEQLKEAKEEQMQEQAVSDAEQLPFI